MDKNKRIKRLSKSINDTNDLLIKELEKQYPEGSVVQFYFMHGQVNPSKGTVIGHRGGRWAYLRVRMHSFKENVRNVSATNILQ